MAFNNENAIGVAPGIGGLQTQLRTTFPMETSRPNPDMLMGDISGSLVAANNPLMEMLNPVGEYLKQQASNQIEPEVNTFLQQVMQLAQQRFPNLGGTNLQGIGSLMPVPQLPTTFSPFSMSQGDRPINADRQMSTGY